MHKACKLSVTMAAMGIAALSLSAPAQAGNGSDIGAGLVGFGIGAILGSMMGPPEVYFVPPPPGYYGPIPRTPNGYGERAYRRSKTPPRAVVHGRRPQPARSTSAISPKRPKTAKTLPSAAAVQRPDRFEAAQAKAKRDGVHTLTQKDIEGLSVAQLKQIRGY
jgi:hypothetical protein